VGSGHREAAPDEPRRAHARRSTGNLFERNLGGGESVGHAILVPMASFLLLRVGVPGGDLSTASHRLLAPGRDADSPGAAAWINHSHSTAHRARDRFADGIVDTAQRTSQRGQHADRDDRNRPRKQAKFDGGGTGQPRCLPSAGRARRRNVARPRGRATSRLSKMSDMLRRESDRAVCGVTVPRRWGLFARS